MEGSRVARRRARRAAVLPRAALRAAASAARASRPAAGARAPLFEPPPREPEIVRELPPASGTFSLPPRAPMATLNEWPPRPRAAALADADAPVTPAAPVAPAAAPAPVATLTVDTQPSPRFAEAPLALDDEDDIDLPFATSARRTWQLAIAMGVLSLVLATLVAFVR